MTEDEIQTKINEIRNNDLSVNTKEKSSCDVNNCSDSDFITDEDESNDIRAEFFEDNSVKNH